MTELSGIALVEEAKEWFDDYATEDEDYHLSDYEIIATPHGLACRGTRRFR